MFLPLGNGGRGAGIYRTEVDVFTVVDDDDDDDDVVPDEGLFCVDVLVTVGVSPLPLLCSEVLRLVSEVHAQPPERTLET